MTGVKKNRTDLIESGAKSPIMMSSVGEMPEKQRKSVQAMAADRTAAASSLAITSQGLDAQRLTSFYFGNDVQGGDKKNLFSIMRSINNEHSTLQTLSRVHKDIVNRRGHAGTVLTEQKTLESDNSLVLKANKEMKRSKLFSDEKALEVKPKYSKLTLKSLKQF